MVRFGIDGTVVKSPLSRALIAVYLLDYQRIARLGDLYDSFDLPLKLCNEWCLHGGIKAYNNE